MRPAVPLLVLQSKGWKHEYKNCPDSPLIALACSLAFTSANAAQITFSDGDFASWTAVSILGPNGGQTIERSSTGGNPDAFLSVTTVTNSSTYTGLLNPGFVYDPSQGAIEFIEASLDFRNITSFGQGHGVATLLLEQAGSYFVAGDFLSGSSNFAWQSLTPAQFTAAAFSRLAGSGNLDFGLSGAPVKFGFLTANDGGLAINVGYDNFSATTTTSPVPAPAGLWLLATGLGGLAARRLLASRPAPSPE